MVLFCVLRHDIGDGTCPLLRPGGHGLVVLPGVETDDRDKCRHDGSAEPDQSRDEPHTGIMKRWHAYSGAIGIPFSEDQIM